MASPPPHPAAESALPRVSVVVPTYLRPALLQRCLRALLQQSIGPQAYEIIIVDDGQQDAVRALVREMEAQAGAPALRYLRPHGRGPAGARNLGWRAARAPIIAFTDDDTIPHPDWLAHGEAALRARPDWSALSGRVMVPLEGGPSQRPSDHERMTQGLQHAEFVTANAFVRRAALARVRGFDERFLRAWREDSDLQFRLMQQVGPVGRCDDARVLHPARRARWGVCLRQQRNTYFDALLYKKHPRLYRERIRRVPPWDYYVIVGATFAAVALALLGAPLAAMASAAIAFTLVLRLAWQRLRPTRHDAAHVLEMLATSALIPYLSVYWRTRGALHFKVLFL
jgi:glycosyltransferase involved in cell wall biosynthesis